MQYLRLQGKKYVYYCTGVALKGANSCHCAQKYYEPVSANDEID